MCLMKSGNNALFLRCSLRHQNMRFEIANDLDFLGLMAILDCSHYFEVVELYSSINLLGVLRQYI